MAVLAVALAWMGVLAAGCGDDSAHGMADAGATMEAGSGDGGGGIDGGGTDGGGVDAAMDAGAMDAGPDADGGETDGGVASCTPNLLVTTSDYTTGGLGWLDIGAGTTRVASAPLADQDSVPVSIGCVPGVLERGAGQLLVQSAADPLVTAHTIPLDATLTDPYAINPVAVVSVSDTKAYVVASAVNTLYVVDPTQDGAAAVTGTVDLSPLVAPADMDGVVDAVGAIADGNRLYVALGRYYFDSSFAIHFDGGSVLAVVDTASDTLVDMDTSTAGVQGIVLTGQDPWRGMWLDVADHSLWLAATGDASMLDGGIEKVDLVAGMSDGFLLDEATAGGDIQGFTVVSSTRVLVLVDGAVRVFDPATGAIDTTAIVDSVDGMVREGDTLFVWQRMGGAAGLRSFRVSDGTETTPSSGPFTFGSLPIYGAAPSP